MPITITLIGSVAIPLCGASIVPIMPPVVTTTTWLPPASAWAIASTNTLRRARRSSDGSSLEAAVEDKASISVTRSQFYSPRATLARQPLDHPPAQAASGDGGSHDDVDAVNRQR